MHKTIRDILSNNPIIPVYTPHNVEDTLNAARKLLMDGIHCIEITLRTECALSAIQALKESDIDICIGVGTIRNASRIKPLKDIGVNFGVSPGQTKNILKASIKHEFPLLPGIATPSELLFGLENGFDTFKLFPANAINAKALLKAFNATFPEVRFCPTGGINQTNMNDYLDMQNVLAVGGSWVFS